MMKESIKTEVSGFNLVPSGGMPAGDYCTGCSCDNEREEPFYITFGNSWNLGWVKSY